MKQSLLAYISCPLCQEAFSVYVIKQKRDEIEEGTLKCTKCKTEYPVTKGIPRILPHNVRESNYSNNFKLYWKSMEWNYSKLYQKRFYEMTGWSNEQVCGKTILESGCGGGRWVYQFAKEGAKEIVAFDYTGAIDKAKEICREFDNIHYVQADIFELPFNSNKFDIVHCHGVLHATPDVREGIKQLADKVKINGELAVLIYRNLTCFQQLIDDMICFVPKRLPVRLMYYVSIIPTVLEYIPFLTRILENIIHLSAQPNFTLKHLHNFDWYTCTYRQRTSIEEAKEWYKESGFLDLKVMNTNEFRVQSNIKLLKCIKEWFLQNGFFLKATLGLRGTKGVQG